jgi:hypothetical protein
MGVKNLIILYSRYRFPIDTHKHMYLFKHNVQHVKPIYISVLIIFMEDLLQLLIWLDFQIISFHLYSLHFLLLPALSEIILDSVCFNYLAFYFPIRNRKFPFIIHPMKKLGLHKQKPTNIETCFLLLSYFAFSFPG